jgi:hypothetical protein
MKNQCEHEWIKPNTFNANVKEKCIKCGQMRYRHRVTGRLIK